MVDVIVEYGSVIAMSTLRLFLGAGLSLAYGHQPAELWLLTSTGSVIGVLTCLLLGQKIQSWWSKKTERESEQTETQPQSRSLLKRVWWRYGLWGLACATIFVGTIPSVAIALVSGLEKRRIFIYLLGGKLAWATAIALIGKMPF